MSAHKDTSQLTTRQTMTPGWRSVTTSDGVMPVYTCSPDREVFGDVIVLMEAFGLTDHIRELCEKLAAEGFRAMAPDLYHFLGPQRVFTMDTRDDAFAAMRALDDARARSMIEAVIDAREHKHLPLFLMGFCMGGRLAYATACERHAFDAIVSFYGGGIGRIEATPQCPVFLAYGEQDAFIPNSERVTVRERLEAAGIAHQLHVYLNAGHGFLCAEREGYHRDAAANAFNDAITFMRESVLSRCC